MYNWCVQCCRHISDGLLGLRYSSGPTAVADLTFIGSTCITSWRTEKFIKRSSWIEQLGTSNALVATRRMPKCPLMPALVDVDACQQADFQERMIAGSRLALRERCAGSGMWTRRTVRASKPSRVAAACSSRTASSFDKRLTESDSTAARTWIQNAMSPKRHGCSVPCKDWTWQVKDSREVVPASGLRVLYSWGTRGLRCWMEWCCWVDGHVEVSRHMWRWECMPPVRGGTYPRNCMMEIPRNHISELHFDRFPDTSGFQCWKTNDALSCSGCPTLAVLWIKKVEVTISVDDLVTSWEIEGHVFLDFEMFDAKIASALKTIITNQYSRRRIKVEEQHAQIHDRFLRGRQVAYMIHENFRAGAQEAVLDLISSI